MSADFDTWGTDSPRRMREALARIIELSSSDAVSNLVDQRGNSSIFGAQDCLLDLVGDIREEAVRALQVSAGGGRLSPEEQALRAPPPPEERVGALHDPVHRDVGRARAAKSVKAGGE